MAKGKNQHVVPHPNGWAVKGEGNKRPSAVVPKKSEATDIAREIARNQESELFIHGQNGQIQSRDSHGHDPERSKG
jgi:hypothetical protein